MNVLYSENKRVIHFVLKPYLALNRMRHLHYGDAESAKLQATNRSLQPLGQRTVYRPARAGELAQSQYQWDYD
jgi:hypothetical protein